MPDASTATRHRKRPLRLLVTGGGTGGHVYPGLAAAEAVRTVEPEARLEWIGSARGIEARLVPAAGIRLSTIPASGFRGLSAAARLCFLANLLGGFLASLGILLRRRPDVVLGTGGYVSLAVGLAARLLGVPVVLQEQNAIPGSTNRLLGRWARRIYLGFAAAAEWFPGAPCIETGNPVRAAFATLPPPEDPAGRPFRLLVFGGSGGALTLNRAVAQAAAGEWSERDDLELLVQTGPADRDLVASVCKQRRGRTEVVAYIDDMPAALARADLVVCRAGAMTLAELAAAGRPAVLVPFPHATDQHQLHNARACEDAGAAFLLLDELCDGASLAGCVEGLRVEPGRLARMAEASSGLARPDSALVLATDLMRLTGRLPATGGETLVP